MRSLIAHEIRMATRRAAWPVAIGLHLAGASLFLAAWGPTGGVPLWSAPALAQFAAADRLLLAMFLTWLVTPCFAPERGADVAGWSGVTGASLPRIALSRAAAAIVLALAMLGVTIPVVVAAAEISASRSATLAGAILEMAGFAMLAVGLTAAAAVGWRNQLAVWCASMAMAGLAAFGVELVRPGIMRVALCLLIATAGIAAAVRSADRRWRWTAEAAS